MTAWAPFGLQPDAIECSIVYTYSPGRPMVMYLRNGDPGYPEEPATVDFVSAECAHPLNPAMQKMLDDWAIEYLASDDGFDDACNHAADDAERDFDRGLDAYERRRA